jgi:hypothetical protein
LFYTDGYAQNPCEERHPKKTFYYGPETFHMVTGYVKYQVSIAPKSHVRPPLRSAGQVKSVAKVLKKSACQVILFIPILVEAEGLSQYLSSPPISH